MALQDLFDRFSEHSIDKLEKEFGNYLIPGESIDMGYKLVRDAVIFTDKRIIVLDRQGTTGKKVKVESVFLHAIVNVTLETSGFGIDESLMQITYISSPLLASHHPNLLTKQFAFQKSVDIHTLYQKLEARALENCLKINN